MLVVGTPTALWLARQDRSPRVFRISAGRAVTFPPGVALDGDTIKCIGGIGAVVPERGTGVSGFADGPEGFSSVQVETGGEGTVTVHCGS